MSDHELMTEMRKWGWEPTDDFFKRYLTDALVYNAFNALVVQGNRLSEAEARVRELETLEDSDGSVLRAIESALFTVAMARGRGERISDQAESIRVLRAVRNVLASRESPVVPPTP